MSKLASISMQQRVMILFAFFFAYGHSEGLSKLLLHSKEQRVMILNDPLLQLLRSKSTFFLAAIEALTAQSAIPPFPLQLFPPSKLLPLFSFQEEGERKSRSI